MGTAEVKAIIQNLYSGIEIREGRRMPTRITGQATLNRIYKPNDQYAHYRSDWYELVSTEPLTQVDSRVYNYDPRKLNDEPVVTQLWYEDGSLVASGSITTSGIVDYKPKTLITLSPTLESQCSIKPDLSTVLTPPYRVDGATDSYRYVARYISPMHMSGATMSTSNITIVPVTSGNTADYYPRLSVYGDQHAPVDDDGAREETAYKSYGNFAGGENHNYYVYSFVNNNLGTHLLQAYADENHPYFTTKLAFQSPNSPTITFNSVSTTIRYTPNKMYEERIHISGSSFIQYDLTFDSLEAGTLYVNDVAIDIVAGSNTITLPITEEIVLRMSGVEQTTLTNIDFDANLNNTPYFLQFTNKQFIKDKYYYTLECRY